MQTFQAHDLSDLIALRRMVNAMHQGRKILARVLNMEDGEDDPLARMLSDLAALVDTNAQSEATFDQIAAIGSAIEALDTRADGEFAAGWIAGMTAASEVAHGTSVSSLPDRDAARMHITGNIKKARDAGAPTQAISPVTEAWLELRDAARDAGLMLGQSTQPKAYLGGTISTDRAAEILARLRRAIDGSPRFETEA